ncbi:immunoglobulin superfamily member 11 isoform X3 [Chiloscyllium punctatum]|uniref:immunoglobulin superfamily member 11 isoform X3 n=1 Tax=Chiloscyllium punctatum TaxID=137246 RepID=UPI003B63FAC8
MPFPTPCPEMVLKHSYWNLWIACLGIICFQGWVESLEVTMSSKSVQVARGETAELPCTFITNAALNQLNIIWTVTPLSNANQPEQCHPLSHHVDFKELLMLEMMLRSLVVQKKLSPSQRIPGKDWIRLINYHQYPMRGTLILRNISTATNGLYQCTASNTIGSSTCAIDLQVVPPQLQNAGIVIGAVVTGILALLLCIFSIVVIMFYWKNKNKYEEEEIPNEIREDDIPPSSSSTKGFHPAGSSDNVTLTSVNTYNVPYWQNKKPAYELNPFSRYNGHTLHSITTTSSQSQNRPVYTNGNHHTTPKAIVVASSLSPSSQNLARCNGSLVRKTPSQLTLSYAVSHANLQRMGGIPVMVPAQNRAGSLV